MILVIDASVAVKWFIMEDRHELARDVLREGFVLLAPDLLLIEVANALRNKARARLIEEAQAKVAIEVLPDYFNRLFRPRDILGDAFRIACQINHPVADCLYAACGLAGGAALLTDDDAFYKKAQGVYGLKTVLLTDWIAGLPLASTN